MRTSTTVARTAAGAVMVCAAARQERMLGVALLTVVAGVLMLMKVTTLLARPLTSARMSRCG
ncbi:MAG: hypothetical protein JRI80_18800 [Deltaproteobacteria bacterium]|nr:hypothetical protein [Deltaproteobacteria bacterium]